MSQPQSTTTSRSWLGLHTTEIGLVAMAVIWGVNFSVMKHGTQVMEPLAFNALRMGLGCAVLMSMALLGAGALPTLADRWRLMGLGIVGHCIYQLFFVHGLARTRAGTAALVVAASPAAVAIVARAFGHERLAPRAVWGIIASISGVMLVVGGSLSTDGTEHLIGDLLVLCAVIAWAFYTSGLLPLAKRNEAVQVASWTLLGGVIPLFAFATPALLRTDWGAITLSTWGAVVYAGVLAMVIAYLFWYRGVHHLGPTRTSMYSNLQPIVAVLFAWAVLGEVPTLVQGIGAASVIGGLYLART
ncbi:MAG: DMT family transporter [Gemmatimonadota bacterium]|jgi:drug/metabolite transporter (DMT)-like permease|nr:DMT family transporter [Gemmatimonadota bacterium]